MTVFRSLLLAAAFAQDFCKGLAAAQAGDYATELQELMPLAEQGYDKAQFKLGSLYENGQGVPQDYTKAVKWYRLAAAGGNPLGSSRLADMYNDGQGVLQNHTKAHMWYNIAAANGDEFAGMYRAKVAKKMTPAAIKKAESMAAICMESGYKDCGY